MIVCILGLGKTGAALARYWHSQGAEVWGIDDNPEAAKSGSPSSSWVTRYFSSENLPDFRTVGRFFISPGVDPRHPAARTARTRGLKLEGELDLAFSLARGDVLAITGTNGKSTTTSFLGEVLKAAGKNVGVGGNLGTPFLDLATGPEEFTCFVVEISSYQLETAETFKPKIAALLNITDDHLDRYADLREYARAKGKIFAFQGADDVAVYNDDDLHVLETMEYVSKPARIPFSVSKTVHGAYAEEGRILWAPQGRVESSYDLTHSRLTGLHNLENLCCAVTCAKAFAVPDAAIQKTIETFQGLPHRIERVARIGDVEYYDDSKATNVGAVVMSLASFDKDVVLIMGGRDKGGDYKPLIPLLKHKAKAVVVLGEAKDLIMKSLKGACEIVPVSSMSDAVQKAKDLAPPGGTVLLSPACSSFDMFRDYHDRGEQFKKCVRALN
jgi:UDP-N-acetylmuramoylalanine--D-glutamate ligase